VRGLRFAFVAFNGVGGWFDRDLIVRQMAAAKEQADVVIAALHWGEEYVSIPQAAPGIANDDPVEIAHLAVDAGADLVLGNHPHWVQGLEVYNDKLIAYAHGNFILDQMWSRETTLGVVGRYTFYDTKLVDAEFLPVIIDTPAAATGGAEAQAVLDGMRQASIGLRDCWPRDLTFEAMLQAPMTPVQRRDVGVPAVRHVGDGAIEGAARPAHADYVTAGGSRPVLNPPSASVVPTQPRRRG
jgi:hypothetical protein